MIFRFVRGGTRVDLTATGYRMKNFTPPPVMAEYNTSTGTSANRYDGGALIGATYRNRQITFDMQITGSAQAEIEARVRIVTDFLRGVQADGQPSYLEFSGQDLPEPLWGQLGAPLRYEIVSAQDPVIGPEYADPYLRNAGITISLALDVKPFATGGVHRVATASGGVYEDVTGSNQATGTRVLVAATNKMTNPAFTHGTYSNGWTAGSGLTVAQNTDERYLYPGSPASPKITSRASTNNTYTQSINVGNTNAHSVSAIVARPDGAAVTSADCQIYYNAAQTTTFESLGNGLYLAYTDNVTGINSATATGLLIASGRTVYLLAAQIEEAAAHTPIIFGDMLGCAWTSTAHASTSSTTAGKIALPVVEDATLNIGSWSVYVNWRPAYASSAANDKYLFAIDAATDVTGRYDDSDNDFLLTDGSNTATTAGVSFSAGDDLHLVFTGGTSGLAIYYYNATSGQTLTATAASYAPPATVTNLYIGSDATPANHSGGRLSAQVYPRQITSAEATAVMQTAAKMVAAGQRPTVMPFLWTKDGDNVVDNCDDTNRDNWAVAAGIPGSMPAISEYHIAADANKWNAPLYLGLHTDKLKQYRAATASWWYEGSGGSAAGLSNGDYSAPTVLGSGQYAFLLTTPRLSYDLNGTYHVLASMAHYASSGSQTCGVALRTSAGYMLNQSIEAAITTTYALFYLGKLTARNDRIAQRTDWSLQAGAYYEGLGSAPDVFLRVDFAAVIQGNLAKINPTGQYSFLSASGGTVTYSDSIHIRGSGYATGDAVGKDANVSYIGDPIELTPGMYNLLQSFVADTAFVVTRTFTYSRVEITPRWALL